MIEKAKAKGVKLLLPVDNVVGDDFSNDANTQVVKAGEIRKDGKDSTSDQRQLRSSAMQ